jgi:opacity protein-like surface antigen
MLNRWRTRCAGAVVAIGVALAPIARSSGQATPTKPPADTIKRTPAAPAKHIAIHKDTIRTTTRTEPGEVCIPLRCGIDQDSVDRAVAAVRAKQFEREASARDAQRRLDSMETANQVRDAVRRTHAAAAAERERSSLDSVARAEAAAREAELARAHMLARGMYVGVAGGASAPQRALRNGYTGGWNTTIPVGWDASDSPFGIRADVGVDHLNGTRFEDPSTTTTAASGDITIWSLNTDLKLRAHTPGAPSRSNVFALGGIGIHRVTQGVYGTIGVNAGRNLSFENAKTSFGWNVGAGVSMAWGPAELFVESRFIQVKSDLAYHMNGGVGTYTSFTPIVIGLQWF